MRFAHHLSSHLTPEWRKHYIDYDDLKRRVYEMIGKKPQTTAEDEELLEGNSFFLDLVMTLIKDPLTS